MATIQVNCRFCNQTEYVRKHGTGVSGFRRFRCLECKRSFQLDYAYEAYKPKVKEQIIDMAMNSSGVRETSRVLKVGYNTVLRTLKNSRRNKSPQYLSIEQTSLSSVRSMNSGHS